MKLFISWSGNRSKKLAEALSKWLPFVVQTVEPWVSQEIPEGTRWQMVLGEKLADTNFGISCITPDNVRSEWLHYEAGALSKHPDPKEAGIIPVLFGDVSESQLSGPLKQFQGTRFCKDNLLKVVERLAQLSGANDAAKKAIPEIFDTFWPKLQNDIREIMQADADATNALWGGFLNSPIEIVYSVDKASNAFISANTYQMEFQAMVEVFRLLISRGGKKMDISASPSSSAGNASPTTPRILIGGPSRNIITKNALANVRRVKFGPQPEDRSRSYVSRIVGQVRKKKAHRRIWS